LWPTSWDAAVKIYGLGENTQKDKSGMTPITSRQRHAIASAATEIHDSGSLTFSHEVFSIAKLVIVDQGWAVVSITTMTKDVDIGNTSGTIARHAVAIQLTISGYQGPSRSSSK